MLLGCQPGHVRQSQHLNVCLLDSQFSSACLPIFHNSLSIFMLVYLHVYLLFSPFDLLLCLPPCFPSCHLTVHAWLSLSATLFLLSTPTSLCITHSTSHITVCLVCLFSLCLSACQLVFFSFFNIHVYLVKCFCLSVLLVFSLNSIIVFTLCGKLFSVKVCKSKSKLVT